MMLTAGAVLLALGLVSGVLLTLAPLGVGVPAPGLLTWVLFPMLTIAGYLLLALGVRLPVIAPVTRMIGGVLLLLAVAATVGLFLAATSLIEISEGTLSLWYVLAIGYVVGPFGLTFPQGGYKPS